MGEPRDVRSDEREALVEETARTAAAPVAATAAVGGSRRRWAIAAIVALVVIGVALAGAALLGRPQAPEALAYVPADSVVVGEMRLDLPGDQRARVGNLLAHFPGFKDQSILDAKIDEALGRIVRSATDGSVDYDTELKPLVRAPVFMFARATQDAEAGKLLVVATVDGRATCTTVLKDRTTTEQTYRDVRLEVDAADKVACAIDGRHALVGDLDLLKSAIDVRRAGSGIDTSDRYRAARAALSGDRLVTLYYTGEGLRSLASAEPSLAPAFGALPDWGVVGIRAEDSALVADVVTAPIAAGATAGATSGPTFAPARRSEIAKRLPADTILEADAHEAGRALVDGLAGLRNDPSMKGSLDELESGLAVLGGAGALLGWIDDAGIAVVPDGSSAAGGLVVRANDARAAQDRIAQLRAFLTLAGGSLGVREETIGDVPVTIVDVGDLASILGSTGTASSLPFRIPPGTRLELAFAVRDDIVVLGVGDAFVRAVLGVQPGASLAEAPAYTSAISRAAAENVAQGYVDVQAAVRLAESLMTSDELAAWKTDTKPYVDPFRALIMTTERSGGAGHMRIVATVE